MAAITPLTFLITGAARGIGRGLTRILLSQGHRVFLLDSNAQELKHTLSKAEAWIPEDTSSSSVFKGSVTDLTDRKAIKSAVDELTGFCNGKLDVLINNAMATTPHLLSDERNMENSDDRIMDEWDEKLAVGLTAPYLLSRLCIPLLKAAKETSPSGSPGTIINISSTRAKQAEADHEAYSAVKAGILGLTQSMSISLGHRHGIRINAISPGWISVIEESEEADKAGVKWEDGFGETDQKWHPAGRVGKAEDVARAVMFLVESGFVTGEELVLDGGVTRKMVYPED